MTEAVEWNIGQPMQRRTGEPHTAAEASARSRSEPGGDITVHHSFEALVDAELEELEKLEQPPALEHPQAVLAEVTEQVLSGMQARGWRLPGQRELRHDRPTAWDVNNGRCEEWAIAAASRTGGEAVWLDSIVDVDAYPPDEMPPVNHCVLVLRGRFYDSQHPGGVATIDELDFVRGVERDAFISRGAQ